MLRNYEVYHKETDFHNLSRKEYFIEMLNFLPKKEYRLSLCIVKSVKIQYYEV